MTPNRMTRLEKILSASALDAVALNPGSTLTYLTGLEFHLMERPTVLLFAPPAAPAIILPELEIQKLKELDFEVASFTFGDNPADWQKAFDLACQHLKLNGKTIGVEPARLRFLELNYLKAAAPDARWISADEVLGVLRAEKDDSELQMMRRAAVIAQDALENTLKLFKVGMSEKEFSGELSVQMLRAGSDSEFAFGSIVSSGPNSANPHASPSERKIQTGELLLVDWGARYNGYCSDLTRVFAVGDVPQQMKDIHQIVLKANEAGRAAGKPGITAGAVDLAARTIIENAGYGKYFFHRTGHGLGMEAHEPPYMFADNSAILTKGNVYTIEPGIYLAGIGGVRIEDDVVVTEDGSRSLTDMPRELRQIA